MARKMMTRNIVMKGLASLTLLAWVLTLTYAACHCKDGCSRDDVVCRECQDGFHGNRCQNPCNDTCRPLVGVVACDKDSGRCLNGCIDRYYGDTCQFTCPFGCRRCISDTNCSVCEDNTRWGEMCEKFCSWQCEGGECNISGVCDRCYFGIYFGQGYYGDQCHQLCSEAIPDCQQCTRDGQKCLVCKSAKYGEQCDRTCPDHCMECNSALNCSRCEPGYYGEVCDQVCRPGCKDQECDIEGRCMQCAEGIFGEGCDMACPDHCLECSSALNCSQCEPGYYGDVCDQVCPVGCKDNKCDIQGRCLQCEAGKFGDTCDKQCNQFCKTLFGERSCGRMDGLCHNCAVGFYGTRCDRKCSSNCVGGCNRKSGACFRCPSGYYDKNRCDKKCPLKCGYCSQFDGSCLFCKDGFYGNRCEQNCDENCTRNNFKICDQTNGHCSGCSLGLYGIYCENTCSMNCRSWVVGALGYCDQKSGNCTVGCMDGWFGETCQSNCIVENCLESRCTQQDGLCTEGCKDGWFGETCQSNCSVENCLEGRCNRQDGFCTEGCKDGWFGETCQSNCSENCLKGRCTQQDGFCTEGCKDGWFGETCQSNCSENCLEGRCTQQDGLCTEGCKDGWFGETCLSNCGNCLGGRCNRKGGMCILGCRNDWFGESCLKNCSNCLGGRCNQTVGMCTLGCKDGWFDDTCQSNCSNCLGGRCNQTDGMCTLGCVPGFIGEDCQEKQKQVELGGSGLDLLVEAILDIALPVSAVLLLGSFLSGMIKATKTYMHNVRKRRRQAGDMDASTGGGQEIPLHTLGHGAGAQGNSVPCANTNAVAVDLQEESSDPNIEVVADLQLFKDRLLSDGRSTPVYEGVFEDSIPVAVKKIHLTVPQYAEELLEHVKILREVETLRKLPGHNHKNIVRYLKSVQTPHFLYIAFELCQGTLEAYVDPQKSWSEKLPWKNVLTQMAKGLQFLHDNANVAHRDLKPSNVLLCKSMFETKVVLADFGQSKVMVNMRCSMTGATGSLGWIAPEVETTQGHYYTESDIFSLGCLFYYVATKGHHPFGQFPLQRQTNISHSDSDLSILQPYLECFRELITDMIQVNHDDRPSAELVSQHPSLLADDVIMDFLHKASNKINGYPLSQQNILEDPTIIPGGSWTKLLPVNTQAHLSTFTLPRHKQPMFKGREGSVRYLLRAIRNCSEHFPDLPAAVRAEMGASTLDHVQFWLGLYPWLLTHVYSNMKSDKSLMESIRKA